jgi:hypothetical protein
MNYFNIITKFFYFFRGLYYLLEQALNGLEQINRPEILIFVTILAVILVAISKSGFGGALGSLGLPVMVFVFPPKISNCCFITSIFNNRFIRSVYLEKVSCD